MIWLGPTSTREVEVHDPDDGCEGYHCYSCGVDERGDAWEWCLECGHGYRTAKDLVRAYRREMWKLIKRGALPPHRQRLFRGNEFEPSLVESLWRLLTIRAEKINFCQECHHDF
jgi:hypothetical protein